MWAVFHAFMAVALFALAAGSFRLRRYGAAVFLIGVAAFNTARFVVMTT